MQSKCYAFSAVLDITEVLAFLTAIGTACTLCMPFTVATAVRLPLITFTMKQYGIVCTVANLWSITVAGVKTQLVYVYHSHFPVKKGLATRD